MTVNTLKITSGPYLGNDLADTFDYEFRITGKAQLSVYETDSSGVQTLLTVDTDYTVAGIGDAAGGTVTRTAGALPTGYTWYIRSNYVENQLTDFSSQGAFFPDVHEDQFDHLTFLIQQQSDKIDRTMRLADSIDIDGDLTIDTPAAERGNLFPVFNADGTRVLLSAGTGADSGLRTDLADPNNGANLIANTVQIVADAATAATIPPVTTRILSFDGSLWAAAIEKTTGYYSSQPDVVVYGDGSKAWVRASKAPLSSAGVTIKDDAGVDDASLVQVYLDNQKSANHVTNVGVTSELVGEVLGGLILDFSKHILRPISNAVSPLLIGNKVGAIAASYFNKYKIRDLNLYGRGRSGGGVGLTLQATADNVIDNARITNFTEGLYLHGALSSDFNQCSISYNGLGIKARFFTDGAGGLNDFGCNANTFYGVRLFENDLAIDYDYNPSGAVNWIGSNIEGTNVGGTAADGKKCVNFTQAGHQNLIGCHLESNYGQYGIFYDGFDASKNLLMLGTECIQGTDEVLHLETGRLTSVGSRITNAGATHDCYFAPGTAGTLIDTEGGISGTLANTLCIRDGKVAFGSQPIKSSPLISATPETIAASSNIVTQYKNDTVTHNVLNSAGTRIAYVTHSNGADTTLNRDDAFGWRFRANNSDRLYVGRSGALAIEPGGDNTISCGSVIFRFSEVHAGTGTINTSDERLKTELLELDAAEKRAAKRIQKSIGKYKFVESINTKGDKARIHFGVGAQTVEQIMKEEGLDPFSYGLLCYDEWDAVEPTPAKYDEEDSEVSSAFDGVPAGNRYGIRYDELTMFILAAM
jgi:hypothetical protein